MPKTPSPQDLDAAVARLLVDHPRLRALARSIGPAVASASPRGCVSPIPAPMPGLPGMLLMALVALALRLLGIGRGDPREDDAKRAVARALCNRFR